MAENAVSVNRAAVLALWAAVVAERLGFDADEALSLGRAVAGLNAQSKGRRLGIFKPHEQKAKESREKGPGERFFVEVCGRAIAYPVLDRPVRTAALPGSGRSGCSMPGTGARPPRIDPGRRCSSSSRTTRRWAGCGCGCGTSCRWTAKG